VSSFWEKMSKIEQNYADAVTSLCDSRTAKLTKLFDSEPTEHVPEVECTSCPPRATTHASSVGGGLAAMRVWWLLPWTALQAQVMLVSTLLSVKKWWSTVLFVCGNVHAAAAGCGTRTRMC
jgi:hypothetical protein